MSLSFEWKLKWCSFRWCSVPVFSVYFIFISYFCRIYREKLIWLYFQFSLSFLIPKKCGYEKGKKKWTQLFGISFFNKYRFSGSFVKIPKLICIFRRTKLVLGPFIKPPWTLKFKIYVLKFLWYWNYSIYI